ncbi:hypothetical protein KUTeg_013214 [Tegillarca granosa]|uniref:Sjoegren syndrome/scleroderma autoantigen 1 n=1 Tax=Tegillarca granosa TaxID=220873 RepID=A0ABQ9EY76_TEGGR|nr:hypothetical protein KUTeg_013214 [Tegillarca granosa]
MAAPSGQNMEEEDYEWQPPSEAEMKIIQARRERSDKISKIMGDYLLKGYKMLGSVCDVCETILLEDKSGQTYCIACRELDTDADKDDPAVNEAAARTKVAERSQTDDGLKCTSSGFKLSAGGDLGLSTVSCVSVPPNTRTQEKHGSHTDIYNEVVDNLCQTIKLASDQLKQSTSVEYSIHLCNLIKTSADAIQSLKSITN